MIELNKIYCIDNVQGMRMLDDESIDLTVTSPPYDNLRQYNGYSFDFENVAKELYRVTKHGGVVVWVVGDATIKGSETGMSFRQALFFMECGFNLHDTMIWEKTCCGCLGSTKCYLQNFEYMFVFSKGKIKTFNPIEDRKNKKKPYHNTANGGLIEGKGKQRSIITKEYGRRTNIWNIQPQKLSKHPAAYPEQLAADHIKSWSNEGDLVLDPFMGSGTTAKVAIELGRKFIGFEISEEYVNLANKRLDKTKSLFDE